MLKATIGIIVALVIGLTAQSCRLNSANARWTAKLAPIEAERDRLAAQVETDAGSIEALQQANAGNVTTIQQLAGKLDAAISETEHLDELLRSAEGRLAITRRERDDALAANTRQQEHDYASNQDCADWGAGAVCGAVSARVSEHWRAAASRRR